MQQIGTLIAVIFLVFVSNAPCHEGYHDEEKPAVQIAAVSEKSAVVKKVRKSEKTITEIFEPFSDHVQVRVDTNYLYIESDSMPEHEMMVGITAWNQQVPVPQPYVGQNVFRIPLNPKIASQPLSAKKNFFRGAIAVAANGVPIFNPIKNDGRTDTKLAGELDTFGGHAGRADDYHYHIGPVHLEEKIGKGKPIAYALDGFPIYGYLEADGSTPKKLDWMNGHFGSDGKYHYHSTKNYPYINGGFKGQVQNRDGQVSPQPRAQGVRPFTRPLRGAKITDFKFDNKNKNYQLEYKINGKTNQITYQIHSDKSATFTFIDSKGTKKTETYQPRQQKERRPPRDRNKNDRPPPRNDKPRRK